MGGSAHPSWHFTYFDRNKYAVAMSADCEMVYSGAGDLPWFMTEIQGGNNTYSGFAPMCPTAEEITQWLWITLGTEGKGAIFWSLNPRSSGVEAGEWAMINYQKQASDRLMAAGKVARSLEDNLEVLKLAKKADPHIHILYSRESMWAEKQMTIWESDYLARENGAVIKSAFAYFEAFCEMGISPNIKELGEFDFSKDNYEGETIILSNQISLPSVHVKSFEHFVDRGGKLIVDALTAYFDENMHNTMITGFDYEKLFGGNVSEFKFQDNIFSLSIDETVLSAHAWKGFVAPTSGTAIKNSTGENIGIRNRFGKGEVVWIPSMLGLGSRIGHSYSGLCTFLEKEAGTSIRNQPVKFSMPVKNTLMKTLKSGDSIITIIINKDKEAQTIVLEFNQEMEVQKILSADSRVKISDHSMTLNPEETLVVLWE
jgi:beta-galactosidase